ncbi:MAG: hypothetical protein WCY58_14005, partial [Mariniphaga sp.]
EERFEAAAYYLAGETEYHRAYRKWAAVQHFTYLTCSYPGAFTSDNFRDVVNLELDPYFKDYVGEAFKPLGVNLSFWEPTLKSGTTKIFKIMLINDYEQGMDGKLVLSLENKGGKELAKTETSFSIPAFGQGSYFLELAIPEVQGESMLKAIAYPEADIEITVSRRKVRIE